MSISKKSSLSLLFVYILFVGVYSILVILLNFPDTGNETLELSDPFKFLFFSSKLSLEAVLIALSFFAGVAGSFLHTAQSLSSYIGNAAFKTSWTAWYLLRPWIGGVLGFSIYFVMRAGFISSGDWANPYGIVAISILGGWFSKTTTDKLQEVFETLFRTDADQARDDKLQEENRPQIFATYPSPVPVSTESFLIVGSNFSPESVIIIEDRTVAIEFLRETQIRVMLSDLTPSPKVGQEIKFVILNPHGKQPFSNEYVVNLSVRAVHEDTTMQIV